MTLFAPARKEQLKARVAIDGPTGSGKALRVDQPVLTPTGWVPIGGLEPGDFVIGSDGTPCTVTGVYPQGIRPMFEVVTSDGVTIIADGDHLWETTDRYARNDGRGPKLRTTLDIAATLTVGVNGRANHYLPMPSPVQHPTADLPVDPYLLGVLLGDGCLRTGAGKNGVSVSSADPEIIEAVAKLLPEPCHLTRESEYDWRVSVGNIGGGGTNPLTDALRSLGILGAAAHDKHVPARYMFADVDQRLALLQGLLDSDGSTSGHTIEFSTTSPQLADDVVGLVQSFGGTVTVSSRRPGYRYQGEDRVGRLAFRLYVKLPSGVDPFRLTRKAIAYVPRSKYQPWRQIVDVRQVGDALAVCIAVDAPDHLFLTAGYVPTHNTWTALQWARILAGKDGPIGLIDTENRSAAYYAPTPGEDFTRVNWWDPPYEFGHSAQDHYDPRELRKLIKAAETELGPDGVLVIDSLTHYWNGEGGTLDVVDNASSRGNSFTGWKEGTPAQRGMIDAIIHASCHVIVTMRSKMEYVLEEQSKGGRTIQVPKRVGMAPEQRSGVEYEFTVVADMDLEHRLVVSKSRCDAIADAVAPSGRSYEVAQTFAAWLGKGVERAAPDKIAGIVAAMNKIEDAEVRTEVKAAFIAEFGNPANLLAERVGAAEQWVIDTVHPITGSDEAAETAQDAPNPPPPPRTPPDAPSDDETPPGDAESES